MKRRKKVTLQPLLVAEKIKKKKSSDGLRSALNDDETMRNIHETYFGRL